MATAWPRSGATRRGPEEAGRGPGNREKGGRKDPVLHAHSSSARISGQAALDY